VPTACTRQLRVISAAVLRRAGGPLTIQLVEMEAPRDDEVLVRLVASGICRTDIALCAEGTSGPAVLGHEGAGIVVEIGKRVRSVRRGDHVVLSYQSCGRCRSCRTGRPAHCAHFCDLNFGFARLDGSNAFAPGRCVATSLGSHPLRRTRWRPSATLSRLQGRFRSSFWRLWGAGCRRGREL